MTTTAPTLLSWSSGKDSAWSLNVLREQGVNVVGLLSTVNAEADRVAMHAVRRKLLQNQAEAVGLPLHVVDLPWPCSNEDYQRLMGAFVSQAKADGIEQVAFGDLFLEDIRAYREEQLQGTGLAPLFPLWQIPTDELAATMLDAGVRATLTCVDPKRVPREWAGRTWSRELIAEAPDGVDPCGEHGEFHTFVSWAPGFETPVEVVGGEVVQRGDFVYADLLPAGESAG